MIAKLHQGAGAVNPTMNDPGIFPELETDLGSVCVCGVEMYDFRGLNRY